MSASKPPDGDSKEAGRNKSKGQEHISVPAHVIVPVKIQAGDGKERWLDYTCQTPEHGSLSEVINEVRRTFFLDESTSIKICTSGNGQFLDHAIPLDSILPSLHEGDHLVIHIEMVKKSEPEVSVDGSKVRDPIDAAEKIRQVVSEFADDENASEMNTSFTIKKRNKIIVYPNDQVFINQHLLHVLKEHVERPLLVESIFLFLGVTLGAISSILVALADDTLSVPSQGKFKAALIVASGMLLCLFILLYFIKSERKKVLRPIIEQLAATQLRPQAKGKDNGQAG